ARGERRRRDPRPRTTDAHHLAPPAPRHSPARPALPVPRVPRAGRVVRRAPPRALAARRRDQPRELRAALPPPSRRRPRRRMEAGPWTQRTDARAVTPSTRPAGVFSEWLDE